MPSFAAQTAVASVAAPHQMRSRRPSECGSRRRRPGGFGNIGRGFGSAKPSPSRSSRKTLGVAAGHVGVGLALGGRVAEVAPAVDHLLGRAAADAELQPAAGDEVGRACVLGHVERVLVAHVDDGGADLDAARPRADGGEQREGRAELAGEVVDPEVGAVGPELLRRHRELDRLERARPAPSGCPTRASATNGRRREIRSSSRRLPPPRRARAACAPALTIKPRLKSGKPLSSHFPAIFQPRIIMVNQCHDRSSSWNRASGGFRRIDRESRPGRSCTGQLPSS